MKTNNIQSVLMIICLKHFSYIIIYSLLFLKYNIGNIIKHSYIIKNAFQYVCFLEIEMSLCKMNHKYFSY